VSVLVAVSGNAGVGKDTAADYLVANKLFVKLALADPLKRICKEVYGFTDEQLWGPSEMRNAPDRRYIRQKKGKLGTTFLGNMDVTGTVYEKYKHLVKDGHLPNPPEDVYLTARYALQTLGTEWGRDCYHNTWIDYGIETAQVILDGAGRYTAKEGLVLYDRIAQNEAEQVGGVVFSDIRFKNELNLIKAAGGVLIRLYRKAAEGKLTGGIEGHASEAEQNDVEDDFFDAVIYNDGPKEDLYRQLDRAIEAAKER